MRWMDSKYRQHRSNYILQSLMAMAVLFVLSMTIDVFLQTTVLASMGATLFLVFTMPHTKRSNARYLIGGYAVGFAVGQLCSMFFYSDLLYMESLIISLAVGLAILIMVITDTEHPPAAGVAMGTALNGTDLETVIVVFACLVFIITVKRLLRKYLIDLI